MGPGAGADLAPVSWARVQAEKHRVKANIEEALLSMQLGFIIVFPQL
jgi:hypothetical protein